MFERIVLFLIEPLHLKGKLYKHLFGLDKMIICIQYHKSYYTELLKLLPGNWKPLKTGYMGPCATYVNVWMLLYIYVKISTG